MPGWAEQWCTSTVRPYREHPVSISGVPRLECGNSCRNSLNSVSSSPMGPAKKILIMGDYKETLIVVRSLGRAGITLIVGRPASQKLTFSEYSRYTSEIWRHPDFHCEEQLIQALVAFLQSRQDIRYVLPIGDGPVSFFARHYLELPESPSLLMPPPEVVLQCQDKIQMYDCAVELGIPTAAYSYVCDARALPGAAERIGFPCVIKPRYSPRSFMAEKKALICNSAADLSKWIQSLPRVCPLVIQQFVSGDRRTAYFIASHGHVLAYFEHQPLRTDHADGTGVAIESISVLPTPDLQGYTARLVEALQYTGVGTSQFFFNEKTRASHFLEVNPRFGATLALPYQCGFDFPLMALQAALGSGMLGGTRQEYQVGKKIHSVLEDILASHRQALETDGKLRANYRRLSQILKSWCSSNCHMTFDRSDPLPTLRLCLHFGRGLLRRPVIKVAAHQHSPRESEPAVPAR